MKIINKINKYLVVNYPLIWNSRLVWMLLIGVVSHLLFYILGYVAIQNIQDLKAQHQLSNFYSDTSVVYYNILLSILILLIWIIYYLRNNAFKNHYRLKKGTLFVQFLILLFIFFLNITQYYSFKNGLTTKIKNLYDWNEVDNDIKLFNATAIFLPQNIDNYDISNKKYPKPFPLQLAKQHKNDYNNAIDTTQFYIEHKDYLLQFYKFNQELFNKDYGKDGDKDLHYYNFKYRIVKDISEHKELLHPSLLNYSRQFFSYGQDSVAYKQQLKKHELSLTNGSEEQIKDELERFISLLNKYEMTHNLTVDNLFPLIFNAPNFLLSELINYSDPKKESSYKYATEEATTMVKSAASDRDLDQGYLSYIPHSKTLYCNLPVVDNFFKNVYEAYFEANSIELLYFYIGFAFVLALILFIFKTTSLRSLLLSIVAAIVILVITVMLMTYGYSFGRKLGIRRYMEAIIFISISSITILSAIIAYLLNKSKIITSVLFSLAVFAIPSLILSCISFYDKYTREVNFNVENYKNEFMIWFEAYGFWVVMFFWLLTVFIYSKYVRILKARPV